MERRNFRIIEMMKFMMEIDITGFPVLADANVIVFYKAGCERMIILFRRKRS